ncbi:TetR/AcrR family transcriptional regulator [Streptomyces sp. R302]|uniref:TetR/AcrR family transcriptional regulator n=1 Tax=unclassified Streptomyces TaxID=2593676 RepID=UPI00145C9B07|nr:MULTISPECIES: TetR/AcrR family transcriptional regulator [unclassified Streptomyces]NML52564.1 TetR/AcrR family transcriptional regulator [Streptomyces sp. R301]NML80507.1 TetR/AcrR family transcriptional regulator [Streptomyces sp. R302]
MTTEHGTDGSGGSGGAPVDPPRRMDARLNRERLVAAAREVFAEAGPGASLNEIARRAGVGPGTLYRHFPGRTELLTAVLRDRIETLCARAEQLLGARDADDALQRWLHDFLDHARANQGMGSALLVETAAAADPFFDCHRRILDAAGGLLDRAQEHGTARADVTVDDLVHLVVGIALSTTGDAGTGPRPHRLLDLVLDAVFGPPATPAAGAGGADGGSAGAGGAGGGAGAS